MRLALLRARVVCLQEDAGPRPSRRERAGRVERHAKTHGETLGLSPVVMGPDGTEKSVYALLRGEQPADRFPMVATDDGKPVDVGLRDELAPRNRGR